MQLPTSAPVLCAVPVPEWLAAALTAWRCWLACWLQEPDPDVLVCMLEAGEQQPPAPACVAFLSPCDMHACMQPCLCHACIHASLHAGCCVQLPASLLPPAPAPCLPPAVDEIIDIVDGPKMITLEQVGGRAGGWVGTSLAAGDPSLPAARSLVSCFGRGCVANRQQLRWAAIAASL